MIQQIVIERIAILPPTILWGASFPLALAAVASPGEDPGRLVGSVYAANTFGAIVGGLLEYNSMYLGFQALYLMAMACYALAFVSEWIFANKDAVDTA